MVPFAIFAEVTELSAIAEAVPVKLPVTFPSKSATSVPFAYPVPEVFTVVVGCTCKSLNICHLPESSAFLNIPEYLSVPPVSYNP